jgi:pimeloyl-ACP methyl ester carboxylesterase
MAPALRLSAPDEATRRQATAGGQQASQDRGPARASSAGPPAASLASPGPRAARMARIRATFLGGLDGWVDVGLALVRPRGFDLGRIAVPVSVWFGGRDTRVPRAHADWLLARVPAGEGHEYPGGPEPGNADSCRILAWMAVPAA